MNVLYMFFGSSETICSPVFCVVYFDRLRSVQYVELLEALSDPFFN